MLELQIIDLFPDFLAFWPATRRKSLVEQIDDWHNIYMAPWPELLKKQLDDYAELGEDWRHFAAEHVFPYLDQRLPEMITIHQRLPGICRELFLPAREKLCLNADLIALFYVGIGCGAGWVTTYENKHAILFGLENVAEEGWTQSSTLRGFVAHEFGHVAHFQLREEARVAKNDGPLWQLYTEGFAQWCEHLLMGKATWHMQDEQKKDWLTWCQENKSWLAAEFVRCLDAGESFRPFFGSWYDVAGYKQTGYFLGHEVIKSLAAKLSFQEIACLENMSTIERALKNIAAG